MLEQETNEEVKAYLQANTLNQHDKEAMTTTRGAMTIINKAMTILRQGMTITRKGMTINTIVMLKQGRYDIRNNCHTF